MTETREHTGCAVVPAPVPQGLRVSGLHKSFHGPRGTGEVRVLQGVDLVVPRGELTAVLGRSGCGKTTLLRLVAGFDRPDAGTIHLDGREVAGPARTLSPEQRRIGYVTQEGNLFPHLTVARNIAFGLPRRTRRTGHRVDELLELVGLGPEYARRHPHELSGGQQQRVALARALAPEPGIVLLDEPFSSLDAELRESTRRSVAGALATLGATTVLVTHDQAEALSLASRVALMRDGAIVQDAPPTELYQHPLDRDVAGFVGDVVAVPATLRGGVAECVLGVLRLARDVPDGPGTVLIRPEQIALDGTPNDVPGQVLGIEYYGHDAMVRLALDTAPPVQARCPGHLLPPLGARVHVAVRGPVQAESGP